MKEAYQQLEVADKAYVDKNLKEEHYKQKIDQLLHKEKKADKVKAQETKLKAAQENAQSSEMAYQTAVNKVTTRYPTPKPRPPPALARPRYCHPSSSVKHIPNLRAQLPTVWQASIPDLS